MIGLPPEIEACLFDLDGVLTQTAKVHAAAWKTMFDEYLRKRAQERGEEFREFDAVGDYDEYVDGKPRYEGVRSFLASRTSTCLRARRATRPTRTRSTGWATARTSWCWS